MKFCIKIPIKYLILLISLSSTIKANDCDQNALLGQMLQVINGNQILTQNILSLSENVHNFEMRLMKYAETFRNIEQSIRNNIFQICGNERKHSADKDWIVIQRRKDGTENFYRPWMDYKNGFGYKNAEFFIGLDKLHKLTTDGKPMELLIIMEDWENERRYAQYDHFLVGDETEKYQLKELGNYSGTAGDSLSYHLNQKFSTKDNENDENPKENCAIWYTGAWWYNACHRSNLNGRYLRGSLSGSEFAQGIHWNSFHGLGYSLKFVEMLIRPRK